MTEQRTGVRFPRTGEGRSSSRTGAAIVADALAGTDPVLADRARGSRRWRKEYATYLAAATRASVSEKVALAVAEDGLRAAWDRMVVVTGGGEEPVAAVAAAPAQDQELPRTDVVRGSGDRLRRVEVPYRGATLHGAALVDQLQEWVRRGVVEPGFAAAVEEAVDHPEWLSMPGHRVVLVGAGAAMGPLTQLTRWGCDVVAVDLPAPKVWDRVRSLASAGSGSVALPVDPATGTPGLHVAADLGAARGWLARETVGEAAGAAVPVLGSHAYADGAAHVEVNVAADVLAHDLVTARPDAVLAYLNTPTDTFLAPADAVAEAQQRSRSLRWNSPAHRAAALASARRLFRPAYAETLTDDAGATWGLSDTLVDVQGPNYALAKRVQRWRAVVQHHAGGRVSTTVAPASWTRSVTRNRVLASVYAGAAPFGVEIFDAATARALLAAKLVADTFRPLGPRGAHPESLFVDAAHGGLWRQPFEPRTALGVAAVLGAPRTLVRRPG